MACFNLWNRIVKVGLLVLLVCSGVACQQDGFLDSIGYLDFSIDTQLSVCPASRAMVDGYQPHCLTVEVIETASNKVVLRTNDYDHWELKGKKIPMKPGDYLIKAHSYGFDGKESGFDIPYYEGQQEVTIKLGELNIVDLTCKLANVKVSVNFDENFVKSFKSAKAKITSSLQGVSPLSFVMGETSASAYFPAGQLSATISVVNHYGKAFSDTRVIAQDAKPRSHYILNYRVSGSGSNQIEVETDPSMKEYTFTVPVPTKMSTSLTFDKPIAWANFAVFQGQVLGEPKGQELDPALIKFEYKFADAADGEEWSRVDAVRTASNEGKVFTAKVIGLLPGKAYVARMVYTGDPAYKSNEEQVTTELTPALPNGQLNDWYQSGNTWYAISGADFNAGRRFWDSSNPGTTTGAAALVNVNPTEGVTSPRRGDSGKSARMKSQFASAFGIGKFAAASLYSGEFGGLVGTNGAKLNLGRPFKGRPTQLTGWFQYSTGKIDYTGSGLPAGAPAKGQPDLWSAYIALTTGSFILDNTNLKGTAKDYKKLLQDDKDNFVVAYGELSDAECVTSKDWKQFTIDLVYKNLHLKPTHVIIVISSSKYGDYFTGSTQSLLYIDDLELVYGDSPKLKNE